MKRGHKACSAPFAVGYAYVGSMTGWVHPLVGVVGAGLTMAFCTFPDYDHPRFRGKRNPIAAAVRGSAKLLYKIRTERDVHREDQHRGPSHCIEWGVLVALIFVAPMIALRSMAPDTVPVSLILFIGGAVALGNASHIVGDVMTPSGVPFSVLYNVLAYRGKERQVWRRHALGLFVTDSAGERVGAVPVLYTVTAVESMAMVGGTGGLSTLWRVTTGDVFDGRWVVLALLVMFAVCVAWTLIRLVGVVISILAERAIVAVELGSPWILRGISFGVGLACVLVPVAIWVPGWLPWAA